MKFCPKCEKVKPDLSFYPDPSKKGGLGSYCKTCSKARCAARYKNNKTVYSAKNRAYYTANKARVTLANAKWAANHRDQIKAYLKEYVRVNKDAVTIHKKKWAKNNPDKLAAREARRRAQELRATPPWADKTKISRFYRLASMLSGDDLQFHVDHIVPLKSKLVCGLHVEANLQVVPASYNFVKGNRYWPSKFGEHEDIVDKLSKLSYPLPHHPDVLT